MQNLIESFLNYCKAEKCLANTTIIGYTRNLNKFHSWYREENLTDIRQITPHSIRGFLALERGPKSNHPGKMYSLASALRSFGKFLSKEIKYDPFYLLESPKQAHKIPEILSKNEVDIIIKAARTLLEKAVIELLYSSALRASELCNIQLNHINLANKELTVINGKGGKSAMVPVGNAAIKALKDYIKANSLTEGLLFPSLDKHQLSLIVKQCAERAGITKRVYPHLFRHSCATHLLDNGADIRSVQEMLRHSSLSTTQIYIQVSMEKKMKEYNKFETMRESLPQNTRVPSPEVKRNSSIKKPIFPRRYSTREQLEKLLDEVRKYAEDKIIFKSFKGRRNGKAQHALSMEGIRKTFNISKQWARKLIEIIEQEKNGKKVSLDNLGLFQKDDFVNAKIKEATKIILQEGKRLYPDRTVSRAQRHQYITMEQLQDKLKVSYGCMYRYIWSELKKDERLVEIQEIPIASRLPEPAKTERPRYSIVVHKTIDSVIADMIKVLNINEETARNAVANMIRNKDKLTISV
jgi:integrase/recombinase XerD